MIIPILIIILCILSGLLNSTEDLIKDKYHESIFTKIPHPWFYIDSWKNKYKDRDVSKGRTKIKILSIQITKPVQFTDWWHFSKMLHLTFLFISMILCTLLTPGLQSFTIILLAGTLRNLSFSFGYNHLFRKIE